MKRDLIKQIKNLDNKELIVRIKTTQVAIQDLVLDKNMDKLTDRKVIFKKRKELALLKTVLQQKELINKLETSKVVVRGGAQRGAPKTARSGSEDLFREAAERHVPERKNKKIKKGAK